MNSTTWHAALALVTASLSLAAENHRNEWYWDSVVNLHIDNHSGLVGKGHSVEQLTEMMRGIPVSMIQVSAFGAVGITTYPTHICPHPDRGDWDTLAAWRQVATNLNTRFGVYINTRGLRLFEQNREWTQLDARGKGKGKHSGFDVCARPSADGRGVLETVFLPMLSEIVTGYEPDAIWVDGDHARTAVCYCPNCKAAWKAKTGRDEPPKSAEEPGWAEWLALEQRRCDAYRQQMASAIHRAHDGCMYTSNHSWRFRAKDPRCAPAFVDTLSGDLSHGLALRMTRLSAMQLSAEERLPYDIMHNIKNISRRPAALPRVFQQGAVTFASGGAWFLWVPGSSIVQKPVQDTSKLCAEFAQARRVALGRSTSLNQTAVLISETSWHRERVEGRGGYYDESVPGNVALALQDACYGVDLVNETILRSRIGSYRTIVLANHRALDSLTVSGLEAFVRRGGLLILTGSALRDDGKSEADEASRLLGLTRAGQISGVHRADLGDVHAAFRSVWDVRGGSAEVLARFSDGKPFLTLNRLGKGSAAYVAVSDVPYPDDDGLLAWVMRTLGNGPAVHVEGDARDEQLTFSLRRKPGQIILHVVNLTSRVSGRRVIPTMQNDIDDDPPLREVKLSLPISQPPVKVSAVPSSTTVAHQWDDGILHLTLRELDVHGAVILHVEPRLPLAYLAASTPPAKRHVFGETIEEDFESLSVRRPVPDSLGRCRTAGRTAIHVTARTAASGGRSLKFVDHPDAPQPYYPYLVVQPVGLNRGLGHFACDLMLEENAEAQIELRETENAREFPVGPSLRFKGKGQLTVAGREEPLAAIPANEWLRVDLIFPLDGSGDYELRLQVAGERQQVWQSLPHRSPDFWRCGWAGIIGIGTNKVAFYVDNLKVARIARGTPLPTREVVPKTSREGPARVPEDGLCSYWRFDEGEGNRAADSSGRDNHGDVAAQWVEGNFGHALSFSGKRGANVVVEDCADVQFGTSNFAILCWVRPQNLDSPKKYRRLMEKTQFPRTWWNIDLLSDGRVEMEMGDENRNIGTNASNGTIPLNAWTHLAIVVDRADRTTAYYLNGKLDCTNELRPSFNGALDVSGGHLYVGGSHMPFIGLMNEVRVYRRSLTSTEIVGIYRATQRISER